MVLFMKHIHFLCCTVVSRNSVDNVTYYFRQEKEMREGKIDYIPTKVTNASVLYVVAFFLLILPVTLFLRRLFTPPI